MNASFKIFGLKPWSITDNGLVVNGQAISFAEITSVTLQNNASVLTNGVIRIAANGKQYILAFPFKQKAEGEAALQALRESYGSDEQKAANAARKEKEQQGIIYDLVGVRGRTMKVYEDRCVIKVTAGVGSFITGNASDGEKTIYYADCVGVQFKESGVQIGYIQLETSSALMNNKQSNFFNENSFTFDLSVATNEKMREVAEYIRERVAQTKKGTVQTTAPSVSAADELKKFKELLDMGVITQDEFDAKKKQLLGL